MGIGFLGMGFQPKWRREDIPIMPKVLFRLSLILFYMTQALSQLHRCFVLVYCLIMSLNYYVLMCRGDTTL